MSEAHVYRQSKVAALASIVGVLLLVGCETDGRLGAKSGGVALVHDSATQLTRRLHTCAACHGEDGVSSAEIFPNLAGQQKDYITTQLTAFRDHTRRDRDAKSYMWGMADRLSDDTLQAIAAVYAAKPAAKAAKGDKVEIARGEAIFEKGVEAQGVLACVSCHGAHAEGSAAIPGLAGQHRDYLAVQLHAFASGARDNAIMLPIAKGMTPKDIDAVTAYLASQ
jgi:cytochrome c553